MSSLVAVVALGVLTTIYLIRLITCTYSLLAGLVLLLGSKRVDFLLHSASMGVNYKESLTNVDLEAAHVLAVELFLGIICIKLVIELNEGEGTLQT